MQMILTEFFYSERIFRTLTLRRRMSSSGPKSSLIGLQPCGYTNSLIFSTVKLIFLQNLISFSLKFVKNRAGTIRNE